MLYFLPFSFPSICLVSIIVCSGANPARSSATRPGGRRGELHLQFALRLQSGTALAQNTHHHEIYITGTIRREKERENDISVFCRSE
jgi:hypothetical protein